MMALPGRHGPVSFWRLDDKRFETTWDSGEGARLKGGRWNPAGLPVVYASLDPSTAILEVAVHKGFDVLNGVPHVLSEGLLAVPWSSVHIVMPAEVPNRLWLYPCGLSAAQQRYGARLLDAHPFVAIPSAVSRLSWNLLFNPLRVAGQYSLASQTALDLDPRLNPPA